MHFLLPFTPNDATSAEAWLQWVIELGGCRSHEITLMPAKAIKDIETMRDLAGRAFGSVSVLPDAEGVDGHPQGPNSMMRQAIWHFQMAGIGPWTFMEPDCIPLKTGWADEWEREYRAYGKPFMGEFRSGHDVTPDYLSGNMVVPHGGLLLAPMLARRGLSVDGVELAFDIVAAKQTLPQAHLTKLLQQVPKNADGSSHSFPDAKALDIVRPGAVLFHPCKDGSLIKRQREKKAGYEVAEGETLQVSRGRGEALLTALLQGEKVEYRELADDKTPLTEFCSLSPMEIRMQREILSLKQEIQRFKEFAKPVTFTEQSAIEFLSKLAKRSGIDKGRITARLRKAGVIK